MSDRINSRSGDRGELTDADIRKMIFERYSDAMRGKESLLAREIEADVRTIEATGKTRLEAIKAARRKLLEPYEIIEHDSAVAAVERLLGAVITPLNANPVTAAPTVQPGSQRDPASGPRLQQSGAVPQAAKIPTQTPQDVLQARAEAGDVTAAAKVVLQRLS